MMKILREKQMAYMSVVTCLLLMLIEYKLSSKASGFGAHGIGLKVKVLAIDT